jgi:hypothetical protein
MPDNEFVMQTIRNLMNLVEALEPDTRWREHNNVDDIMGDANNAILILKKGE